MKKKKGDGFEKVRKMRTFVECVNYLFGGTLAKGAERSCNYNHHLFVTYRGRDSNPCGKERGRILDITDEGGRRIFSAIDRGWGFRVKYFNGIKKPKMINVLFEVLGMPYYYQDKTKDLIDISSRCVYDEGEVDTPYWMFSANQDKSFDLAVKMFCADIDLLGGYVPHKLKKEIMMLKTKLLPVIKRNIGEILQENYEVEKDV